MKIIEFIFSFLFVRNWHTGQMELSRPRVMLFGGMLSLVLLSLIIVSLLNAPIVYTSGLK